MSNSLHKAARDVLNAWDHYGTAECLRGWIDIMRDALAADIGPEPAMVRSLRNVAQHYRNLGEELADSTPARVSVAWTARERRVVAFALRRFAAAARDRADAATHDQNERWFGSEAHNRMLDDARDAESALSKLAAPTALPEQAREAMRMAVETLRTAVDLNRGGLTMNTDEMQYARDAINALRAQLEGA